MIREGAEENNRNTVREGAEERGKLDFSPRLKMISREEVVNAFAKLYCQ